MLERRNLVHIAMVLVTISLFTLPIVEIFFPFHPQKSAAIVAVERYGGGANPWESAEILAVIDAIPKTVTVLVDYTNSQQRCIAAHQVNQRFLSGVSIYAIETLCTLNGITPTPFEIRVNMYDDLYLLWGFSHDENAKYVQAVWSNGIAQKTTIENGTFFFYQSEVNKIEYIIGLDAQQKPVTEIFSIP